ncbi:hypothetical protein ID866_5948 [Astraeus odoratus]|nr:hypothetical protein ID866_5948 [Astraeus odoratus]
MSETVIREVRHLHKAWELHANIMPGHKGRVDVLKAICKIWCITNGGEVYRHQVVGRGRVGAGFNSADRRDQEYIINADAVHHLYLAEFQRAYPDAKLIGVVETLKRMNDSTVRFDGLWGRDPPNTAYGFENDIKHCYFSGFRNKDVAFLHVASKSLIEADLLLNLPATEQYSKCSRWIPQATLKPNSWAHQKVIQGLATDIEAMKRDAKTVASWDFDRIIPCHGDVIEHDGNKAWREAYKFFID